MYTEYYGMKEQAFSLIPDPSFLYFSKQHRTALTMLLYGLQSKAGVTVISGEVGSGKTTLIRRMLQEIDANITVGLISNAHSAFGELLEWVLMAFGVETEKKDKASLYKIFTDFLIKEYAENRRTVLIIDEAQNLDINTLEELRLLSNINFDKHLVLQLVLVGQPELLQTMQRTELRQLAQRVLVDFKLTHLKYNDTVAYIKHRLEIAGAKPDLFDIYAMAVVHYYSGGIPRLINTLCDYALVYGFAEEAEHINLQLMLDVVEEKLKGGVFPFSKRETIEAAQIRTIIKYETNIDIAPKRDEKDEKQQDLTGLCK
jgi:type II secretory pathway predicted ATPase ExeA